MSKITHIVVHYSATPRGQHHTVEDIRRWHKARGFSDIGYHYVVYLDGSVHKGRQPETRQGAHVKGHNKNTIGICWIGGTEAGDPDTGVDTRTPEQTDALITLIDELLERHPNAEVVGHRDIADSPTQCPGFDVIPWWEEVENNGGIFLPPQPDVPKPDPEPQGSPQIGERAIKVLVTLAIGVLAGVLAGGTKRRIALGAIAVVVLLGAVFWLTR